MEGGSFSVAVVKLTSTGAKKACKLKCTFYERSSSLRKKSSEEASALCAKCQLVLRRAFNQHRKIGTPRPGYRKGWFPDSALVSRGDPVHCQQGDRWGLPTIQGVSFPSPI